MVSFWCIWLDAVQKKNPITKSSINHLKSKGYIEGRYPNYIISLGVAQMTHQLPHYNKVKGLEKSRLKQMVEQFISTSSEGVTRKEIMEYVSMALPMNRTDEQKTRILGNLLREMKVEETILSKKQHWFINLKRLKATKSD